MKPELPVSTIEQADDRAGAHGAVYAPWPRHRHRFCH